ncbi:hypothetical protein NQ314_006683 [Rhamnusium bicolor]|uniref:Multiple inositol polyphosphate phosphatase 1 n=1 Tax=Rhamnusium bicolor TaxID=1586634 RepID=A0AAV8YXX7_9CUCU|nr:hypothetical protein NQ314_006683 [Rhamnusium bicolor]
MYTYRTQKNATASAQVNQNVWQNQNQQFGGNQDDGGCCEEYCYSADEEPYINFATKTAYDSLSRRSGSQHILPVLELWRLSWEYDIMLHYIYSIQFLVFRWIWNETVTEEKAKSLTSQGVEELSSSMKILTEIKKVTKHSSRVFFGSEADRVHANVFNDERLINPEENCKTWTDKTLENSQTESEYNKFLEKPEYLQMTRDVFRRLGFKYSLNASIINDIYDICRYEKAWNVQQRSPWCIAFTTNQLKLLEYAEDLKYYYRAGYGNKMANKIGCASVKDFYQRFKKTVNGNSDGHKATFFFTHSLSLQSMLTTMDIAKDYSSLTADNYYQQSRRNWRTSIIDPFASNLAAVLYQCRGAEKHKVMFFLNEIPVELPECSVGLCNWSTIQQKFESLVNNCNVEEFCDGNSAPSHYINHLVYVFAAFVISYFRF